MYDGLYHTGDTAYRTRTDITVCWQDRCYKTVNVLTLVEQHDITVLNVCCDPVLSQRPAESNC